MNVGRTARRKIYRFRDALARTLRPIERFEEIRIGPQEAGIVLIAFACVLFFSSIAGATRYGQPDADAVREPGHSAIERLIGVARAAWRVNDHETVIDTLSRVIGIRSLSRPAKAAALMDRGNAYLQLGDPEHAVRDLDESLALSPDEPERAYLLRGMAYEMQGEREQAAWNYIRALREAPRNEAINRRVMRFFTQR